MGVKGLKKYIISCKELRTIDYYSNKTVAIDTSIFLYKFKYGGSLINSFYKQIKTLRDNSINFVYVFDNKPHQMKSETIQQRKIKWEKMEEKIDELNLEVEMGNEIFSEELEKLNKQYIKITPKDTTNLKTLFDMCGVNYITAKEGYDAEAICSLLSVENKVDAIISNDIDTLAYSGKELITNFNNSDINVEVFNLSKVLEFLELSYDQFITMCLISGCDFCKGEFKYGPKKSHVSVKKGLFDENENYKELSKIFNIKSLRDKDLIPENFEIKDKPKATNAEIMKFIRTTYQK